MLKRNRVVIIIVAVVFAVSLIAIGVGVFIPREKVREVTLGNYSHNGQFTCTYYTASIPSPSQTTQGTSILFPKIIEDIEILFRYSGPVTGDVNVTVILEDWGGDWQKEISVETVTGGWIAIPLDLDNILETGDRINEELGRGSSRYYLKIIAEDESTEYPVIASLEGLLDSSTLEWQDNFSQVERGFPGTDYWIKGAFGYRIQLKQNELFGPIILEKEPSLPDIVVMDSSGLPITDLVESMDINFSYQFDYDGDCDSLSEIEMTMILEEAGRWQRSFTLVPSTVKDSPFTITIPLDVGRIEELATDAGENAGGRVTGESSIIISAKVRVVAETDSGTIDDTFYHQLAGTIGEMVEWLNEENAAGAISLVSTGRLSEEILESNSVWQVLRISSVVGLAVSLLFMFIWVSYWWMVRKQTLSTREQFRKAAVLKEEELSRNRKEYGDLISEVQDLPQTKDEEITINVMTLEALVKISNNSLKPILLRDEVDRHIYCIIDGSVRYIYTSEFVLSDKMDSSE